MFEPNFDSDSVMSGYYSIYEKAAVWPWIVIGCLAAAVVVMAVLYCTFLSARNEGRFHGFAGWLYNFLNSKKLYFEPVLRIVYLTVAIFLVLYGIFTIFMGFGSFGQNLVSGLIIIVAYNVIARLVYEFLLLIVSICRNLTELNRRMGGKPVGPREARGEDWYNPFTSFVSKKPQPPMGYQQPPMGNPYQRSAAPQQQPAPQNNVPRQPAEPSAPNPGNPYQRPAAPQQQPAPQNNVPQQSAEQSAPNPVNPYQRPAAPQQQPAPQNNAPQQPAEQPAPNPVNPYQRPAAPQQQPAPQNNASQQSAEPSAPNPGNPYQRPVSTFGHAVYCGNCGKQIPSDCVICPWCGAPRNS